MALRSAKPVSKGNNGQDRQNGRNRRNRQYWTAVDLLSPLSKHMMSTYLQVSDEEAMPLLGEYFDVAVSFMAFGSLVHNASSSCKRMDTETMPEELARKFDTSTCSRFERMALETTWNVSMERLRKLAKNDHELKVKVRDLADENKKIVVATDNEKAQLLIRIADAEKVAQDLSALRKAQGRAFERAMNIVAENEQRWLKDKRNFEKEIEKLKETVTAMNRETKFQSQRCQNPTCKHCCKGIISVVRNVKGRTILVKAHSLREETVTDMNRETKFQSPRCQNPTCKNCCKGINSLVKNVKGRTIFVKVHSLRAETVTDTNRETKFQSPRCQNPTCKHCCKGINSVVRNVKGRTIVVKVHHSLREALQTPLKREVIVPIVGCHAERSKVDHQAVEEDQVLMKSIELKMKQRGYQSKPEQLKYSESSCSSVTLSISKEHSVKQQQDMESELASMLEREGSLKKKSHLSRPGPSTSEEGLPMSGMLSVDNDEGYDRSCWEEASDPTVELEKALELTDGEGVLPHFGESVWNSTITHLESVVVDAPSKDGGISSNTNEQPEVVDRDDDLVALQEILSLGAGLVLPEHVSEPHEALPQEERKCIEAIPATPSPADLVEEEIASDSVHGIKIADAKKLQLTTKATKPSLDNRKPDAEGFLLAGSTARSLAEHDDEQVLGVVQDADAAEIADDSQERDPSALLVYEQNHTEHGSGVDVNEKWGVEDRWSSKSKRKRSTSQFNPEKVEVDISIPKQWETLAAPLLQIANDLQASAIEEDRRNVKQNLLIRSSSGSSSSGSGNSDVSWPIEHLYP